jgi:hypothetical protein
LRRDTNAGFTPDADRARMAASHRAAVWVGGGRSREGPPNFVEAGLSSSRPARSRVRVARGEAGLLDRSSRPHRIPNRGALTVHGYAFAGGDRHVARVDVSIHGGASGRQANLLQDLGRWAWRQWRITLDLAPGEYELLVRAWDSSAATQPEDEAALWTPRATSTTPAPGSASGRWPMKRSGLLRPLLAYLSRNRSRLKAPTRGRLGSCPIGTARA